MKQYAHVEAPIVWIKGDHYNLLGDHFHPLLVVLTPVWWLWPSPLALLWTQAVLLAVSAIPLTRVAMRGVGNTMGIVLGASYLFSFGLQGTQNVQFHEYALAVPLLAFGVTAILDRRPRAAALWLAPLVLVKEDLGLTVMVLGAVMAWMLRDRAVDALLPARGRFDPPRVTSRWLRALPTAIEYYGVALAAWGLGWFILATFVVLPLLSPTHGYEYSSNVGSLIGLMVPADKWVTATMFVAFMGVVGLKSPLALALVPTFAWRFLGTVEFYWTWQWHYNSILMPVAFAALLHVLPSVARSWRRWAAVGLSVLSTAYLLGALPLTWVATGAFGTDSEYANSARAAVDAVPDGSTVAADVSLLAPLVPKASVQWLHGDTQRAPDCVAHGLESDDSDWAPNGIAAWANETWPVSTTTEVVHRNGAPVQVSADAPFDTVYEDAYFSVICQQR